MNLIHVCHGDRYWSKILYGTIHIPVHDTKVKVTDIIFMFKFELKLFTVSVFAKPLMALIHVWHSDRNLCKLLRGTIPPPGYDL